MQKLTRFFDRLEPPLGALETAYRRHYLSADIMQASIFWLLIVVLKLILLAFHLFSPVRNATYYLWVADDILVSGLLFVLTLGLRRITEPARYDRYVAVVLVVLLLDNGLFAVTGPRTDVGQFAFDLLLVVCFYMVVPLPLAWRVVLAGLVTALSLGVLFLLRAAGPIYSASVPTLLVGTNVLGLVMSTRVYNFRRHQFRTNREVLALNEQLAILAETDALTQVFNRRRFVELCAEEFARHKRYGAPCSLAVLDVDLFKQVNDQFGHAAGDEVLRAVAHSVVSGKRSVDHVGRLGGEEFGLLLPETALAAAVSVVDRIRQRLAEAPITVEAAQAAVRVTFSAGVTQIEPGDASIEAALRRADQLLYQAKQAGRNRVEGEPHSVQARPPAPAPAGAPARPGAQGEE